LRVSLCNSFSSRLIFTGGLEERTRVLPIKGVSFRKLKILSDNMRSLGKAALRCHYPTVGRFRQGPVLSRQTHSSQKEKAFWGLQSRNIESKKRRLFKTSRLKRILHFRFIFRTRERFFAAKIYLKAKRGHLKLREREQSLLPKRGSNTLFPFPKRARSLKSDCGSRCAALISYSALPEQPSKFFSLRTLLLFFVETTLLLEPPSKLLAPPPHSLSLLYITPPLHPLHFSDFSTSSVFTRFFFSKPPPSLPFLSTI